jgi:hypothetical protein
MGIAAVSLVAIVVLLVVKNLLFGKLKTVSPSLGSGRLWRKWAVVRAYLLNSVLTIVPVFHHTNYLNSTATRASLSTESFSFQLAARLSYPC